MSEGLMKRENFEEYLEEIRRLAKEEGYDSLDETYVAHLRARYDGTEVVIGKGNRVTLREMKQSDLEQMYQFENAVNEPVLQVFLRKTKEESEQYFKAYLEQMYPLYDYGIWAAELSETKEVIGFCGLGRLEISGEECTDLGYYISPEYRRQGYASECVQIILDYAKNYVELPVLYAKAENQISEKLLKKYGFQQICKEKAIFSKHFIEKNEVLR